MTKELETLNDYVDGYLMAVYEEPNGTVRDGKAEFLEKFRASLAAVPSSKEGDELVKTLNRALLKASSLPAQVSLNRKKGFEEALTTLQTKIKDLFNLEDLTTGTVLHYLQDVPYIPVGKKLELPSGDQIFANGEENAADLIRQAAADMEREIDKQQVILERHLNNNGKVIVISDEGYSDMTELEPNALRALVEGGRKSKEHLNTMVQRAIMMINRLIQMRKDQSERGEDPEDRDDE